MARLPEPGGDEGDWGDLLNAFLLASHNDDGTIKDGAITADSTDGGFERTSNKGQAEGYAELDADAKVPATQLPSTLQMFEPAVISIGRDDFVSDVVANAYISVRLDGYLTPPLPAWLSVTNDNELVFHEPGVYEMRFAAYLSTATIEYITIASLFDGAPYDSSPKNSIGSYDDASGKVKTLLFYVCDTASKSSLASFVEVMGALGHSSHGGMYAVVDEPLNLSMRVGFSGGGSATVSLSDTFINKLR